MGPFLLVAGLAAAAPVFGTERGLYDVPFDLVLAADAGGELLYSVDGSPPSLPYGGPVPIATTTTVRAIEVAKDGTRSPVGTHTFLFVEDVLQSGLLAPGMVADPVLGPELETSLRTLPSMAITIVGGLTLVETAGTWEWIDPAGDDAQVDAGVHVVGGTSYAYPKASIRLNFRAEYGYPRLEFDLYGPDATGVRAADEADALTLRSGNHDTLYWLGEQGQQLRNHWMDETQLEMGHVAPHGRFAHLYVNGAYHGVFHVRERFGAGFLSIYLGGQEEQYEVVNGGYAEDGDASTWATIVATSGDYEAVQEWLDVENYLDYMLLQYYGANAWDWWPDHNWMAGGPADEGRGGFVFHSNDSDICLVYDATTNILSLGGPSDVFPNLLAEGHPDFLVALADAVHRNLEDGGPLVADRARDRYARIAAGIESAMVPEAARWGEGWWDRDGEWRTERDRLLDQFFPYRTDVLLQQVGAAGWYPVAAPVFDTLPGEVAPDTVVTVQATVPGAELWVTVDGTDPRLPGGAPAPTAALAPGDAFAVTVDHSTVIRARQRAGDTWGAVEDELYTVDEDPPLLLNEWNAVGPDEVLARGDAALGTLPGNGGEWIELLVLDDGLDLRGWTLTMEDRLGEAGRLVFTDDPLLAFVRAGTLVTIATDLPEDAAYDPAGGDWRFHLRAGEDGSARYVSATAFEVTPQDWRLTAWDAEGHVRFGPVGESVEPRSGIGGDEVGALEGQPDGQVRPDSEAYGASDRSTFGAPNVWDGGVQDLDALRGLVDCEVPPWDTGAAATTAPPTGPAPPPTASGCGCGLGGRPGALAGLGVLLLLRRRGAPLLLAACAGPPDGARVPGAGPPPTPTADCYVDRDADGAGDPERPTACTAAAAPAGDDCDDLDDRVHPGAPETCDGADEDCDGTADDDPVDGLPFHADADGDGAGSDALVLACALVDGLALTGGDCDDADPQIGPQAAELCDEIDQDCDGDASDALGATAECAAIDCLAVLAAVGPGADGPYWIAPGGVPIETWCDLTTDGGGFTLGFVRNSASLGNQGGFGGPGGPTADLAVSPDEASGSAVPRLSWHDLAFAGWTELRVAASLGGTTTYTSRTIPRSELRIAFGEDGYLLYGGATGYYWCGGDAAYTDAGIGAVANPPGAPADCKGHGSLGSGWDFSESPSVNLGLTLCGADASSWMYGAWGAALTSYGTPGAAQAIWVR